MLVEFPETSDSLIERVTDASDSDAWQQFTELYRPVLFRIARARGLQHCDALDLAQQVLISVSSAISRYEKRDDGSRFRNWLSRITRNAILKALSRKRHDQPAGGSEMLNMLSDLPDAAEADALLHLEYRRELLQRAANAVRHTVQEDTWQAFEWTVLQGQSVQEAADKLQLSTGSVYAARSRIMRRLRDEIQRETQRIELTHERIPDEIH